MPLTSITAAGWKPMVLVCVPDDEGLLKLSIFVVMPLSASEKAWPAFPVPTSKFIVNPPESMETNVPFFRVEPVLLIERNALEGEAVPSSLARWARRVFVLVAVLPVSVVHWAYAH